MTPPVAAPATISPRLTEVAPALAQVLKRSQLLTPVRYAVSEIRMETVMVAMRDGVRLATDLYLPPVLPGPVVAMRTPYSRGGDSAVGALMSLARRGYVIVSQDVRGTGDSEPDAWDFYVREPEDGWDLVEWITQQDWYDGFIASCGGSYVGQTQWHMAMHPRMSAILPDVSGLGVTPSTANLHLFLDAYVRSVGKGEDRVDVPYYELEGQMIDQTLAGGYYNDPLELRLPDSVFARFRELQALSTTQAQRRLWEHYCSLGCADRADFVKELQDTKNVSMLDLESMSSVFGPRISLDRHTLPHPDPDELVRGLRAPALVRTGWYDWFMHDALATWEVLRRSAQEPVRSASRLLIAPAAHNMPGYHEGMAEHPELHHAYGMHTSVEFLHRWYSTVRDGTVDAWPRVVYYLMGANEWRTAEDWPVPGARPVELFLQPDGALSEAPPPPCEPDRYCYDPEDPTPTIGGSIVSFVYPPGSVDVSAAQERPDVLTYTTEVLEEDLDVVGPVGIVLHASSSAVDTDFVARLSDVFPDGRAIQLQSGILRARFRDLDAPALLEPGEVYCFEIDLAATANRFKAGHRLRVDISSADFPKYDRNTNLGGTPGNPVAAHQAVFHDPTRPSRLRLEVLT